MPKPKVFVFAPIMEHLEWQETFEEAGCELVLGKADWHNPQGKPRMGAALRRLQTGTAVNVTEP